MIKNIPEIDRKNKVFLTKENSFKHGVLIVNPRVLYTLKVDNIEYPERYGNFDNPYQDTYHFLIHHAYGVTLSNRDEFYKSHNVVIEVDYIMNDGNLNHVEFIPNHNGIWEIL